MKTKLLSTAILGAGALALLSGCLSGSDLSAEARQARANDLKFIQESSAPIAAQVSPGAFDHHDLSDQLDAIGCPKLGALFRDLFKYSLEADETDGSFPQSFVDYLACFGLKPGVAPTEAQLNEMMMKFQNPQELLNCICGGDGLSLLLAGKIELFSAQGSAAADVFTASNSKAAEAYDGSNSKAADNHDASQSKAAENFGSN